MPVRLTVYDGARCIGGNKVLLESDGTAVFLDFGTSFSRRALFFEEFLPPRSRNGLVDLLEMGLLPPLMGLYRDDLVLHRSGIWDEFRSYPLCRAVDVQGVLLSHAHVDHSGYISFLRLDVPVYTGLMTAVITKAMQDCGKADFEREVCYASLREVRNGVLHSGRGPYQQRPFVMTDGRQSDSLLSFWGLSGARTKGVDGAVPSFCTGPEFMIGGLRARRYPVDHSIPGAGAFAVSTGDGWVVYTGDLRMHGKDGHLTMAFVDEASKLEPLVLIVEGTHPQTISPVSEDTVYRNALDVISKSRGLAIADFGPRNIERLICFRDIAMSTGRRLGITARDAYLLKAMHIADPGVPDPESDPSIVTLQEPRASEAGWEAFISACPRVSAEEVRHAQGDYLLCLSFFDLPLLIDLKPDPGGIYVYSSSEAFNEEMAIDHNRLRNWLDHFNLRLVGDPGHLGGKGKEEGYHSSGHIHGPGLIEMVRRIKPRYLVPVHTQWPEGPEFFLRNFARDFRLVLPEEGRTVTLA